MKSICHLGDASSSSIVSDPGDFQCVKVAAHELGHRYVRCSSCDVCVL